MSNARNRDLIIKALTEWNTKKLDDFVSILHADVYFEDAPTRETVRGLADVTVFFRNSRQRSRFDHGVALGSRR